MPWLIVIAFLVIVVSWLILRRTVLGVHIYAVGGNENAARLSGIKVWAVLLFVYGASGLLAGLGGVMQAARLYAANGLQLGQSYELDAIAAVILGGTSFVGGIGSIWGTLIGALIIAVLTNGLILLGVTDVWQYIAKGAVIIGAVALDRYRLRGSAAHLNDTDLRAGHPGQPCAQFQHAPGGITHAEENPACRRCAGDRRQRRLSQRTQSRSASRSARWATRSSLPCRRAPNSRRRRPIRM